MKATRSDIEILQRGRIYSVRFRVPPELQPFDPKRRKRITKTLGTDSPTEAALRAPIMRAEILAELRARAGHHLEETLEERVRRLADLASGRGFGFRTAAEIAEEPLEERLRRVEAIKAEEPGSEIEKAVLGGAERAQVMLSGLVAHVEALEDTKHGNRFKNEEQMKRWRQSYERAVRNLRAALKAAGEIDDKPVASLESADARLHRAHLKA